MGCNISKEIVFDLSVHERSNPEISLNRSLIEECLKNNPLFREYYHLKRIKENKYHLFVEAFTVVKVHSRETICMENSPSRYLYILQAGCVSERTPAIAESSKMMKVFKTPCLFGEADFISGEPRKCSYVADKETILCYLSIEKFVSIVNELCARHTLAEIPLFSSLSDEELKLLNYRVVKKSYSKGKTIVSPDSHKDPKFFVIAKGHVSLSYGGDSVIPSSHYPSSPRRAGTTIHVDAYFGEERLILKLPDGMMAIAATDVDLFEFDENTFQNYFGSVHEHLRDRLTRGKKRAERAQRNNNIGSHSSVASNEDLNIDEQIKLKLSCIVKTVDDMFGTKSFSP